MNSIHSNHTTAASARYFSKKPNARAGLKGILKSLHGFTPRQSETELSEEIRPGVQRSAQSLFTGVAAKIKNFCIQSFRLFQTTHGSVGQSTTHTEDITRVGDKMVSTISETKTLACEQTVIRPDEIKGVCAATGEATANPPIMCEIPGCGLVFCSRHITPVELPDRQIHFFCPVHAAETIFNRSAWQMADAKKPTQQPNAPGHSPFDSTDEQL
jgi:hypothetical protein